MYSFNPTRFQPKVPQLGPVDSLSRQPTRCGRGSAPPHFTPERAICPQRPALSVFYLRLCIFRYLPVFVFLKLLLLCVCHTRSCVFVPLCKAHRGASPRVLRLQYLQSSPTGWLSYPLACPHAPRAQHMFSNFRYSFRIVMPLTRFVCGRVLWCDLPSNAVLVALCRDAALREQCSALAYLRDY
jgi:hypothetical protein